VAGPTLDAMGAVDGLLEPEAGQILEAALEPLARPAEAGDPRSGRQRPAAALAELARRALAAAGWPRPVGWRPQLLVTVDLDSLLGHPGGLGGDLGWAGPLDPAACRRLACDGVVTRVVGTRHSTDHDASGNQGAHDPGSTVEGLQARLPAAMVVLPPTLGGAPSQPLDVGRATGSSPRLSAAPCCPRPGLCLPRL